MEGTRRAKNVRHSLHKPAINISNQNGLHDSGIVQDFVTAPSLSRTRSRSGKSTVNTGSNHDTLNGFMLPQLEGRYIDNDTQHDMDPLEYEFLQQQIGSDDNDENALLMDSLAITSNSLNGSRSSLVSYMYF